jgi:7,8-dihydropterin-6-yl-methyl-4-(beta-D-ribofuranosyl)aminobenzene 5'-phosphate synthase
MGALPSTLDKIRECRGRAEVHVNPGMFNERAIRLGDGRIVPAAKVPAQAAMAAQGAAVVNDPASRLLLDRHFYLSGEIPRVTSFENGRSDHLARAGAEVPWQPDPLLLDERMLVADIRGLGLVVVSACSHAGIVNVCTEVRALFPDRPIHCVIGGLHLGGVMERLIPETVEGLRPFAIRHIITGHCTGWRALHALANAFGEAVSQSAVGTSYTFAA